MSPGPGIRELFSLASDSPILRKFKKTSWSQTSACGPQRMQPRPTACCEAWKSQDRFHMFIMLSPGFPILRGQCSQFWRRVRMSVCQVLLTESQEEIHHVCWFGRGWGPGARQACEPNFCNETLQLLGAVDALSLETRLRTSPANREHAMVRNQPKLVPTLNRNSSAISCSLVFSISASHLLVVRSGV